MKICGLDEVGRGALAGPLVAAAVILPKTKGCYKNQNLELKDSKQLTVRQREKLYQRMIGSDVHLVIEIISVRQINNRGIGWANKEIFKRLIKRIDADKYIVDGNLKISIRGKTEKIKSIKKADTSISSVMAASIVAKVTRDRLMIKLGNIFPDYGWSNNVGYGTQKHIQAIKKCGKTKHHRDLFVKTALSKNRTIKKLGKYS